MNQEADYTLLPKEEYDLKFKKLSRDDSDSYSVNIIPKITPEKVVKDFGIEKIINRLLPLLVIDINEYPALERVNDALGLSLRIMSLDNPAGLEEGKRKYSSIIDSKDITESLAPYVLKYIITEANKSKFPISLTINDVHAYWKAGVQNA